VYDQSLARQNSHFQISTATPAFAQTGQGLVGEVQDLCARVRDGRARRAASATSRSSTCVVMTDSSASAEKPPPSRTMRAAFEAAAITDGSSTAMGIKSIDAIDDEIEAKTKRHGIDTNGIFDHAVGARTVSPPEEKRARSSD
jgi:hypothetical protein